MSAGRCRSASPAERDWRRARVLPGRLFIVGDPKQSIYRFRRADTDLYRAVQKQLVAQGARSVHLSVSFRSVPELQDAVNAAFAPLLASPGQAYVPLERCRPPHSLQPALIALPVPEPYADYKRFEDNRINESLPDTIAAWVHWLLTESGWTVTDRENPDQRVPIEPRHICLLFRHFRSGRRDLARPYIDALEKRQIPHLVLGAGSFHDREEIEVLRNALTAIERPDDELMVFATLRGPLFAFPDATLLRWREHAGPAHPLRLGPQVSSESPAFPEVVDALAVLRKLHIERNRQPAADTIAQLLEHTRAHAALANWGNGAQVLTNIDRLMALARRAEQRGLTSFRAFVDWLNLESERNETSEARAIDESVQGIRIRTAHRSRDLNSRS